MALSKQDRAGIIEDLTTNCECWNKEGDDDILNALSDDKLVSLKTQADHFEKAETVANAAVKGFKDGDKQYRLNPDNGNWEAKKVENRGKVPMPDEEDEEEEAEQEEYVDTKNKKRMSTYSKNERPRYRTADDWFRNAPPEVQKLHELAQNIEAREKDKIIANLLGHKPEGERAAYREWLVTNSLEALQNMQGIFPKAAPEELEAKPRRSRIAANRNTVDDDYLDLPSIDWSTEGKDTKAAKVQQVSNSDEELMTEDDELQQLSPQMRAKVLNATAIQMREKKKLIDEIISNANLDDEQEERMLRRLERKDTDELNDLLVLSRSQRPGMTRQPTYLGAAGGIATNLGRSDSDDDDVLPLPVIDWSAEAKAKKA